MHYDIQIYCVLLIWNTSHNRIRTPALSVCTSLCVLLSYLFIAKTIDHKLVGAEGVAYEYEADSDSEGDSVLDYLGNSEDEEESESEESDQESDSLPATPPPDDSKCVYSVFQECS